VLGQLFPISCIYTSELLVHVNATVLESYLRVSEILMLLQLVNKPLETRNKRDVLAKPIRL